VCLVAVVGGEIVAVDVAPVECLWEVLVRNRIRFNVLFLVFLDFLEGGGKLGVVQVSKFIFIHLIEALKRGRDVVDAHFLEQTHRNVVAVDLKQRLILGSVALVAVSAIFGVRLLILADVSLPAEISSVYRINHQVHFIGRLVLQVHVMSLLGLLSLNVLVLMMAGTVFN